MGIFAKQRLRTQKSATLELDSTKPTATGHRLLGFILQESLAEGAAELWLIPQAERLLILHKVEGDWYQLLHPVSFHQRQIINALRGLAEVNSSGEGEFNLETESGSRRFRVTLSPGNHGQEAFLEAL